MCKKQTSVFHSSTENISLDAGLRMDGLHALDLGDVVTEVLRSSNSTKPPTHPAAGNCSRNHTSTNLNKRETEMLINYSQLCIFENNKAVIKVITYGHSVARKLKNKRSMAALSISESSRRPSRGMKERHTEESNKNSCTTMKGTTRRLLSTTSSASPNRATPPHRPRSRVPAVLAISLPSSNSSSGMWWWSLQTQFLAFLSSSVCGSSLLCVLLFDYFNFTSSYLV